MEWHEGRLADVYTFRNGKAIQFRAFADDGRLSNGLESKPQMELTHDVLRSL